MHIQPIVKETEQELLKIELYALHLHSPQQASSFIKLISIHFPLTDLSHLKRIKKTTELLDDNKNCINLYGLIAKTSDVKKEDLVNFLLQNFNNDNGQNFDSDYFNQRIIKISASKYPATDKKKFDIWKTLWPMNFHNDYQKHDIPLNDIEIQEIFSIMNKLKNLSVELNSSKNVGLIYDPKKKLTTLQTDLNSLTDSHPLNHCILQLINASAKNYVIKLQKSKVGDKRKGLDCESYLLKDMDVFVLKEPCIMCSMALVHSRVSRIFYVENTEEGGLEGLLKVHLVPSLNHHYRAFKLIYD
ncbi:adenosine deaminase, tRNA-specific 3 [Clydaea vesicula]|uniref:Adenosine deaminase, tRNA-specific 3 n=1 Tax=Clydaea vesicula TaxID=447962 RepID=A0AAD5XYZ2_9FUNG|nr:adenosine deaminase, tRNA-specific 3 [Clydaea vesicula]